MVSVTVDAGWREDRGQAIQKLQGRETQGGPTGRVWFRQDVEDLVGAAADEMEAVEGKGRPSTALAVLSFFASRSLAEKIRSPRQYCWVLLLILVLLAAVVAASGRLSVRWFEQRAPTEVRSQLVWQYPEHHGPGPPGPQ